MTEQAETAIEIPRHWGPTPGWWRFGKIFWGAFFRTFFRYKYYGAENVPATGPILMLSNHTSLLDPMIIGVGSPRPVAFLGKAELFDNAFVGYFIKHWGTYPLHRERVDASAVRIAMRVIRDNQVLCIFPEGTRTLTGQLQEFKPGTSKLALRMRAPIVPVGIIGGFEAFGKQSKLPRFGTKIVVRFGKPFELDWDMPSTPENIQHASDLIRERVAQLILPK